MVVNSKRPWLLTGWMLFCGLPGLAQVMDHGTLHVRDKLALDAGVGKYSLIQEGNISTVEIFDPKGAHLADCEMDWGKFSVTSTCLFKDGGHYRHLMDFEAPRVEMEDLRTGERFAADFVLPEGWKEPKLVGPGEELPAPEISLESEGDKSLEEAEQDWGAIAKIMSLTVAEVRVTLDIRLYPQQVEFGQERSGGTSSFACGDGEVRRCGSSGVTQLSIGSGETECCVIASGSVDLKCLQLSFSSCCANSFCRINFCALGFCNCSLTGFFFECVECV